MTGKHVLIWVVLLACLSACGGGGGSTSSPPVSAPVSAPVSQAPVVRGTVTSDISIDSAKVGATYPIQVYVPADYATTTDTLPVIYALDGDAIGDNGPRFLMMAGIMESAGVRAVLVGVGNTARRDTDYQMPGAIPYYEFLTTELIPVVEARYRVNPATRTVAGHSFGGLFVMLALTMDRPNPRYFANFIMQDASFWDQPDYLNTAAQAMFTASAGNLPGTTLIFSSAQINGNDMYVEPMYQAFVARNYQGLLLYRLPTYQLPHEAMFSPSFRDSITILFN